MPKTIEKNYQIIQIMQIMNLLHRLSKSGEFNASIAGMSVPQLACIGYLAYQGESPVYQRDLESCFNLRRSTISSLLTTLEKKALVRRVPVAHDARLRQLLLTQDGHKVGARVKEHFSALNRILVADLSGEEQESLFRLLEKMESGLARRCP